MKKTLIIPLAATAVLAACVSPGEKIQSYSPVAMSGGQVAGGDAYNLAVYECRQIAAQKANEYHKREMQEAFAGALAGAVVGAVIGDSYGDTNNWIGTGAIAGAASEYDPRDAQTSANRIVDRCLEAKGYNVISDHGRG